MGGRGGGRGTWVVEVEVEVVVVLVLVSGSGIGGRLRHARQRRTEQEHGDLASPLVRRLLER